MYVDATEALQIKSTSEKVEFEVCAHFWLNHFNQQIKYMDGYL